MVTSMKFLNSNPVIHGSYVHAPGGAIEALWGPMQMPCSLWYAMHKFDNVLHDFGTPLISIPTSKRSG